MYASIDARTLTGPFIVRKPFHLRRPLSRGIRSLRDRLLHIQTGEVPISQQATVKQVQALACLGVKEIMDLFDDVDVRLDDILTVLRDMPAAVAGLRPQPDWLFRTNRAWTVVFADWAAGQSITTTLS